MDDTLVEWVYKECIQCYYYYNQNCQQKETTHGAFSGDHLHGDNEADDHDDDHVLAAALRPATRTATTQCSTTSTTTQKNGHVKWRFGIVRQTVTKVAVAAKAVIPPSTTTKVFVFQQHWRQKCLRLFETLVQDIVVGTSATTTTAWNDTANDNDPRNAILHQLLLLLL